ncbi:MAG TPA: DMT family transporter [Clostridiaceae bacterium]|nr:DMT family transporter [Clostridiaceae bacterium]
MDKGNNVSKTGYLCLLNTVILFSTFEVVGKTLVGAVNPFFTSFVRFLVGGLVLFLLLLVKKDISISRKDLIYAIGVGIINVSFSMNLLQFSLSQPGAQASIIAVIFSCNPIFVSVFSAIMDKEKFGIEKLLGLLIGIAGIFIIFSKNIGIGSIEYKGPLLALLAAILFGIYTVLGRRVSVKIGSLKMNAYSFIGGSLAMIPVLFFIDSPITSFDIIVFLKLAYLAVFVTGLAYFTYFIGLSLAGASKGSLVFFLKPVFSILFAMLLLGEEPYAEFFIGTGLIILGIAIIVYWDGICKLIRPSKTRGLN